jgi:SAM-dependent methyltransferase
MIGSMILDRERQLRAWFTKNRDPLQKAVDGLDIGWGGVQRWATARMPVVAGLHLDVACGYATFLAQLGWRFPAARLVGLNIDFAGPHALARPLLVEAGVEAMLMQADARWLPFASGSFDSVSCFLGLQDIEIGFGQEGVQGAVAETARVLRTGGALVLIDEFLFERFDLLLAGLPLAVTDRAERPLDVRWGREVAERAVALYAEGWAAQARLDDEAAEEQARRDACRRMAADMERQLAERGHYVPFGPVRIVVARKELDS